MRPDQAVRTRRRCSKKFQQRDPRSIVGHHVEAWASGKMRDERGQPLGGEA